MKAIITGGSGLIGRTLCQHLADNGHEVVVLSRNPGRVTGLPAGVRALPWDAKTGNGWAAEIDTATAIINLAGENLSGDRFFPTRWTPERRERILSSRLQAGQAVVDAVRQATEKPAVVVQSSAIGIYGPHGDEALTETAAAGDDFLADTCVQWEQATAAVEALGVRRVIIRTGIYLTPEGGALQRLLLPYRLFAGGPFGNGQQWYSWIHPADEAGGIRCLIENADARGAFNLTAPQPLKNKDFGQALGKALRRPSLIPLPALVFKLAFGEVATVVVDGQRVLPARLQALGYAFQFPELEAALRDLLA